MRYTMAIQGQALSTTQYDSSLVILDTMLIPLPENDWEVHADSNDMAGVAAGMIYGDSLDLLPPDGGNLLNIYNKALERDNRFTFSLFAADQDFSVAILMGLGFVDTSVVTGNTYAYVVYPHSPDSLAVVQPGFVLVRTDSAFTIPAPQGLTALAEDKQCCIALASQRCSFYKLRYRALFRQHQLRTPKWVSAAIRGIRGSG